jgi:hypothetical protein
VCETADNILDPNTTLLLPPKFFHSAQPLQQGNEDGNAPRITLELQLKISGEVIEITILKFESFQIVLIASAIS